MRTMHGKMATSTSAARFVSLDKEELDRIADEKDAVSTKRVVNTSVNILKDYCVAKGRCLTEIENFTAEELNTFHSDILRGGKTSDRELYAKRSDKLDMRCVFM